MKNWIIYSIISVVIISIVAYYFINAISCNAPFKLMTINGKLKQIEFEFEFEFGFVLICH